MNWMRERDALIAQTLAFVQSVTGKKDDFAKAEKPLVAPPPKSESATPGALEYALEALQPTPSATWSSPPQEVRNDIRIHSPDVASEVAAEVRDRIASFRSHQERFRREREEYFSKTLAKVRAGIREIPRVRPDE